LSELAEFSLILKGQLEEEKEFKLMQLSQQRESSRQSPKGKKERLGCGRSNLKGKGVQVYAAKYRRA